MIKEYDDKLHESVSELDLFKEKKSESTVNYVINTIKELLITKKLLPGDRLPSEIVLSKSLKVSRGSIREAMKVLLAFNIVEIHRGNGTFVSKCNGKVPFYPLLFSFILTKADKKELVEFREIMEFAVVKLIIKNADSKDLKVIEESIIGMEKMIKDKYKNDSYSLAQCDLNFHMALGHATNNKLVEKTYNLVMEFFTPYIRETHRNQVKGLKALNHHRKIYKNLLERNIDKTIKAVEESILDWKYLSLDKKNE